MMTYGDGVADIDIRALLDFHRANGKHATLTAAQPSGKFGALRLDTNDFVTSFEEKPRGDGSWVNAGFFVLESEVFNLIRDGDETIFERGPLESLARSGMLAAYKHKGFWRPMDTLRDKIELENLWATGNAPWMMWNA
jgi:glucose-1-phosphate cytidylyltransferase